MSPLAKRRPWFGAATPNGYFEPSGLNDLTALEARTGVHTDAALFFFNMDNPLNVGHVQAMNARGSVALFTIIPPITGSSPNAAALAAVNSGTYDAQISANATGLIGTRHIWRFMHEMNGNFNAYGQQPTDFLAAWNRIRGLVRAAGNKAPFLWCPNVVTPANTVDFTPYYPGDGACELVGLDGYSYSAEGSHTFSQLFVTGTGTVANLAVLKALSPHPVVIGEVGVATALSGRDAWFDGMFSVVQADPRIVGVNYWNRDSYVIDGPPVGTRVGAGMRAWRRATIGQT